MADGASAGPRYSIDEFKTYYDSAEKVTDRRLAANTWNYSLCTTIMIAIAALGSWSSSRPDFRLVMFLAIVVLSGMGRLLCILWTGQIRDFKALNAAKFEVLNSMAPGLRFGGDDALVSATPFAREWEILKARQAATKVETMQIVALGSSDAELIVPTAFRWLFSLIAAAAIAVILVNWTALRGDAFDLKPASSAHFIGKDGG